jgi:hypothetical protein
MSQQIDAHIELSARIIVEALRVCTISSPMVLALHVAVGSIDLSKQVAELEALSGEMLKSGEMRRFQALRQAADMTRRLMEWHKMSQNSATDS